ncbi:hypothetical protein N7520_002699 [Penicillium odoratum]|uniref:uncharacterized protein n=1 Tax=Penicillium odoratum TaxID=1167516 RepID=UPI0025468B53|nr:uncharacterized protein N7520_002699 [Penicillium odoratum]KAJ5772170.1 hypothetical protein N7520_002699 [Penicillium odoratum]
MPTKEFRIDLQEACLPGQFLHLSKVIPGEYDGSIAFDFHDLESDVILEFQVVISGESIPNTRYDHSFVVFSSSDNIIPTITKSFERAQDRGSFTGISINAILIILDRKIHNALRDQKSQSPGHSGHGDDFNDSDGSLSDYEEFSDDEQIFNLPPRKETRLLHKLRDDLHLAKAAGFKVGYLGSKTGPIILSIARRMSKFDISEEAMQAWDLQSSEYLVLLIRYPNGYQDIQGILEADRSAISYVQMRIGLCDSYKPSCFNAALLAFQAPPPSSKTTKSSSKPSSPGTNFNFRPMFIGPQINKLLNERLLGIMNFRKRFNLSWTGAEFLFHASQGKGTRVEDASDPQFQLQDTWVTPPPSVLTSDHYLDTGFETTRTSFPLVAIQFTLRHFVRCTEFCLVCHCKTFDSFEALKPYVCSKGLCLFQYMNFGMGPNLEHDIRKQPNVVDLLVSLAYARAKAGLLEDFPTGLGIQVPDQEIFPVQKRPAESPQLSNYRSGLLKTDSMTLFCQESGAKTGDWIFLIRTVTDLTSGWHCRVQAADEALQTISLSQPIASGRVGKLADTLGETAEVDFVRYDTNFDNLSPQKKQIVVLCLLETLPSIDRMSQFLGSSDSGNSLSSWRERITPAALDMLRWIVASNRSCILQDDENPNHLVREMPGFMQFRIVQGAPDKEQRFVQAVKSVSMITSPKHPTFFAWHGSPVCNWHSILREGLNFDKIANGRACGNGVYFSSRCSTSISYSNQRDMIPCKWPRSKLNMQNVLSLNELVNSTADFVCTNPHYAVGQLDWIQLRYLFVGSSNALPTDQIANHIICYDQDPKHKAFGSSSKPVMIPLSAVSSRRREMLGISAPTSSKKRSLIRPASFQALKSPELTESSAVDEIYDDCASVLTATTDLNILLSDAGTEDDDVTAMSLIDAVPRGKSQLETPPRGTDFVPGTLSSSDLPLIPPPRYATTNATKQIQRRLQFVLKIQKEEVSEDLGWHLDPNLITTVYQWIVELHSFDSALPLAQDLKTAKINSIVLELRFPPEFPMSPPFIRVVRPRFLEFAAGGGGHVTAGGAMCMELLTNTGWSPAVSMDNVLLQVRLALSSTEPRPARLAKHHRRDYGIGEAVEAFRRACLNHGWQVPSAMLEHISISG